MKKQILVSIDDNVLSHLLNVAQVRKMSGTGFTASRRESPYFRRKFACRRS